MELIILLCHRTPIALAVWLIASAAGARNRAVKDPIEELSRPSSVIGSANVVSL